MPRPALITRRRFAALLIAAASGAAMAPWLADSDARRYYGSLVLGPVWLHGSRLANSIWPPARRIRRHFSYLRFDPGTVERFVADFERHIGVVLVGSNVHMRFLMSTDFFQHGADESRTVGYALFYEPTVTLCYNPLSPGLNR